MSTPPRVSSKQAAAAADAIVERHLRAGDDTIGAAGVDPSDLLFYLRANPNRVAEGVRADDLYDAATLHVWLWWQHQDRERWLFTAAQRLQLHHGDFGATFGIRSPQGVRDRRDRLESLLSETGTGRPSEQDARSARAAAGGGEPSGDEQWLAAARDEVLRLGRDALTFWLDVDEDTAEEMVEMKRDVESGTCTAQTVAWLRDAVWALSACALPKVQARAGEIGGLLARLGGLLEGRERANGTAAAQ